MISAQCRGTRWLVSVVGMDITHHAAPRRRSSAIASHRWRFRSMYIVQTSNGIVIPTPTQYNNTVVALCRKFVF